jgi:predicted ATPase
VLVGLWGFYVVREKLQTALELAEQLLSLAQGVQDSVLLLETHYSLGTTLFYLGELAPARAHLEQSMAFYDPQKRRSAAFSSVQEPAVGCLSTIAHVLWGLGYPDQALKRSHEVLTLAHQLSHPFSLAFAQSLAAVLHYYRREGQAAQERAEAVMTLCTEHGFPLWVAGGRILRGWALAQQGQGEEAIAEMRQGMDAWRATGAEIGRPYWLAMLAESCGKVGRSAEGLSVLAEALAMVHESGERRWEAELHRLKGELLLMQSSARDGSRTAPAVTTMTADADVGASGQSPLLTEVEACFRQALAVAHRQSAKSMELRAAMSLGRLWQHQGKWDEARELLAEIYGWFTEGFETADLQEAKALLEELS